MLGSSAVLSATVAPLLSHVPGRFKGAFHAIAEAGLHAVQLSASVPGMRPRELDRRARKDLQAQIARSGLMIAGIDLMIPRDHWLDSQFQDHAVSAMTATLQMAADLGHLTVSTALPVQDLPEDIRHHLLSAVDGYQIALAVHAEDQLDALNTWQQQTSIDGLQTALDPAGLIAMHMNPTDTLLQHTDRLRLLRLDDFDQLLVGAEGGRCPLGKGELDIQSLKIAAGTVNALRSIVIELRGLREPVTAMHQAVEQWQRCL